MFTIDLVTRNHQQSSCHSTITMTRSSRLHKMDARVDHMSDKPGIHSCDPAHSGRVSKPGQPGFVILRDMNGTIVLVNRDRHGLETCFALARRPV
jgi:hypothetical protein